MEETLKTMKKEYNIMEESYDNAIKRITKLNKNNESLDIENKNNIQNLINTGLQCDEKLLELNREIVSLSDLKETSDKEVSSKTIEIETHLKSIEDYKNNIKQYKKNKINLLIAKTSLDTLGKLMEEEGYTGAEAEMEEYMKNIIFAYNRMEEEKMFIDKESLGEKVFRDVKIPQSFAKNDDSEELTKIIKEKEKELSIYQTAVALYRNQNNELIDKLGEPEGTFESIDEKVMSLLTDNPEITGGYEYEYEPIISSFLYSGFIGLIVVCLVALIVYLCYTIYVLQWSKPLVGNYSRSALLLS
jgi:hypothetical protein